MTDEEKRVLQKFSPIPCTLQRTGTVRYQFDNFGVKLRRADDNNFVELLWWAGALLVQEKSAGASATLAAVSAFSADEEDVWYDVYVQLDGANIALYAGTRDGGMKRLARCATNVAAATNRIEVRVNGNTPFMFDDFRAMARAVDAAQTSTFTYGGANQLTATTSNGVTTNYAYDPWGKLVTRSKVIGGTTYTATHTYRFGDKLTGIASTIPGETASVAYNYDGLGKRRFRNANGQYTWWRCDLGWNVVTQYADTNTDWTIAGFNKMFVGSSAEAVVTSTPSNATYTYLAHDHLGTGRFVYNQSKTQSASVEHYPYGARYSLSATAPYHEFTGKPWDADAGLFYFPYRYFRPDMARWTSADPIGPVDGPNVYGYVRSRPIMNVDRLGLSEQEVTPLGLIGFAFCRARCEIQNVTLRVSVSNSCTVVRLACDQLPNEDARQNCRKAADAICNVMQCLLDILYDDCIAACECNFLGTNCDKWCNYGDDDPRDCFRDVIDIIVDWLPKQPL